MFIRSERLFLRPGWPEDWIELLAAIDDEEIVRNLVRVPWPYTADDARDFLSLPQERMLPRLFVTLPSADGARLIGGVGFTRDGDAVSLGYWIARAWWGQGYATEAVRAALSLGRALGHRAIVAHHFEDNPASGRVLRKAGFRPTGEGSFHYGAGRGGVGMARRYALDLAAPGDREEEDDLSAMRAA